MSSAFTFDLRQMTYDHVAGVVALQRACFPPPFPEELLWRDEHLIRHIALFPAGQLVAMREGAVIASASNMVISEHNWLSHQSWDATVGGPFLDQHDPVGSTLYGLDFSVHPRWRGRGIGRALYQARFLLVRSLRLARYGTACRIPDYKAYAANTRISPSEYVDVVVPGDTMDRTLTPLLRYGLTVVSVIDGYMADEESGDAAVLLEWSPP
jgi:GNAT superfamily N-acetyltransferase